jgi:hypothetical protein
MSKRYLLAAQSFGFGPAAKAAVISRFLRIGDSTVSVDFAGSGIALELSNSKNSLYDRVIKLDKDSDFNSVCTAESYDYVVSVMNPDATVAAHVNRVKNCYVDSLFWFWDWANYQCPEQVESIRRVDCIGAWSEFKKSTRNSPHSLQLAGHLLSEKSYIQHYPGDLRDGSFASEFSGYEVVGPIVDTTFRKPTCKDGKLVVSLCGQVNPMVSINDALQYGSLVIGLLRKGLEGLYNESDTRCSTIIIGNSAVTSRLEELLELSDIEKKYIEFAHLGHDKYYQCIGDSVAVVCPPSITTMYDAFAYEKPVLFIPEQHDGHYPNYCRISGTELNHDGQKSSSIFPGEQLTTSYPELGGFGELQIPRLYQIISNLNKNPDAGWISSASSRYTEVIKKLADREYASCLRNVQSEHLTGLGVQSINGGFQIAQQLLSHD